MSADSAGTYSRGDTGGNGPTLEAVLQSHLPALERLFPASNHRGTLSKEEIGTALRHFEAIRQEAESANSVSIQKACEVSIRLLQDAKAIGYSHRNHGYIASGVLPFLSRYGDEKVQAGGETPRATGSGVLVTASTDELFKNFYDFVSASQRIEKRMASFRDIRSYHYKDLHYIRSLLEKGPSVSRVLDVGCCGTVYPKLFDHNKVQYIGVDISQISLDRMAAIYEDARISWIQDDATSLDRVEDGSVDLILATQVLEHLPDPERAVASMIKKLRPKGRLMLGTEAALRRGDHAMGRLRQLGASVSLLLGSYFLVRGMFPYVFPHRELHSYVDLEGQYRTIGVPHFHFHPLFFERVLKEQELPARVSFIRVTSGTNLLRLGAGFYFTSQEVKAKIPVFRFIGGQVFVVLERTA